MPPLFALTLMVACGDAEITLPPGGARPDVILISIDTLRADHVGTYGYERPTSPNLDAFAASSIRYTRAFSAAGVCATSRSALITGMHPSSLGTQHMRSKIKLPDDIRPFPVALREAGSFCVNRGKEDFNFDTKRI